MTPMQWLETKTQDGKEVMLERIARLRFKNGNTLVVTTLAGVTIPGALQFYDGVLGLTTDESLEILSLGAFLHGMCAAHDNLYTDLVIKMLDEEVLKHPVKHKQELGRRRS